MPLQLLMRVASLLVDSDPRLQEQAFHIVRHVADGVEDVELLFSELGGSDALLGFLSVAMESDSEDVVLQVCTSEHALRSEYLTNLVGGIRPRKRREQPDAPEKHLVQPPYT